MNRIFTAALWLMGLSLAVRLVLLLWPNLLVLLAAVVAGLLGLMVLAGVVLAATWAGRPLAWHRRHWQGSAAGALVQAVLVFWYPGYSHGQMNWVIPEGDLVELLVRSGDAGMPRRYAQYLPEQPSAARLLSRFVLHALHGALLGMGLGEMVRYFLQRRPGASIA